MVFDGAQWHRFNGIKMYLFLDAVHDIRSIGKVSGELFIFGFSVFIKVNRREMHFRFCGTLHSRQCEDCISGNTL